MSHSGGNQKLSSVAGTLSVLVLVLASTAASRQMALCRHPVHHEAAWM
jgi:hypothetical protein